MSATVDKPMLTVAEKAAFRGFQAPRGEILSTVEAGPEFTILLELQASGSRRPRADLSLVVRTAWFGVDWAQRRRQGRP